MKLLIDLDTFSNIRKAVQDKTHFTIFKVCSRNLPECLLLVLAALTKAHSFSEKVEYQTTCIRAPVRLAFNRHFLLFAAFCSFNNGFRKTVNIYYPQRCFDHIFDEGRVNKQFISCKASSKMQTSDKSKCSQIGTFLQHCGPPGPFLYA